VILSADIGGTKALFACFSTQTGRLAAQFLREYPSRSFRSPEAAAVQYLSEYTSQFGNQTIRAACFALAGPIAGEECRFVNLGWRVSVQALREALPQIEHIIICNDLEATGYGIDILPEQDLKSLNPEACATAGARPDDKETRRAIIAPGTGLGEAFMSGGTVFAADGAHCEFGPRTEPEARLWLYLHKIYGHVSYERILSGEGLRQLERFVSIELGGNRKERALSPADVTRLALSGLCPLCSRALDIFVDILGAEAGNLALKYLALDGVYIAGGIPPKILPRLEGEILMRSFCEKGRFSDFMKNIPVYAVLNPRTALYGAAVRAARKLDTDAAPTSLF